MKQATILLLAAAVSACGGPPVTNKTAGPELNTMAETSGDWSRLAQALGRTPAESGLLQNSDISVDLNSLLGPDLEEFRVALGDATPLSRDGSALVTVGRSGNAYLVIVPADLALEAGLRRGGSWRRYVTSGAEIVRPASVERLVAS